MCSAALRASHIGAEHNARAAGLCSESYSDKHSEVGGYGMSDYLVMQNVISVVCLQVEADNEQEAVMIVNELPLHKWDKGALTIDGELYVECIRKATE